MQCDNSKLFEYVPSGRLPDGCFLFYRYMMTRKLTLTYLLCLLPMAMMAYAMNNLTVHQGLGGGSVYKIFKDRYGMMWFGTSNGLNSYDGLVMKVYNASEKRRRNEVYDIAQTTDGVIYAATENGVYTPSMNEAGKLLRLGAGPEDRVYALAVDEAKLYVGSESGLYIMEGGKEKLHVWLQKDKMSQANSVNDIIVGKDALWLLGNKDVYRYDLKNKRLLAMGLPRKFEGIGQLRLMSMAGHRLFVGSYNDGLLWLDMKTGESGRYVDVGSMVITDMQADDKTLYVATDGAGVSVVSLAEDKVVYSYSTLNGLVDNSVYSFLRTATGVNWFGYFRRGVSHGYLSFPLFHCFEEHGFSTSGLNVRSFCIDGERKIIGTREGLYYYDGTMVHYYSPKELGGGIVTSIVKYAGMYYIATFDNGVCRLDPHTGKVSRFGDNPLLRTASFGRLVVSPKEELWMAGNAGVFSYYARTGELRHFDHHNSQLYDCYANSLMFDRQGRCWIGTHEGICVYNPTDGVLRSQGFPRGFKSNVPEPNFVLGQDNDILSYSVEGLYKMDEGMEHYGLVEVNPVIENTLVSMVAYDGKRKQYWVGTDYGLFCFDKEFQSYRKYGCEYGVLGAEFSTNAAFIDEGRCLWLGTTKGLLYVKLDEIGKFHIPQARILLGSITIGGRDATEAEDLLMLKEGKVSLGFSWGVDELAFRPVLLNYSDLRDTYYEYRVGDDGKWKSVRSGEKAVCEGLTLGKNVLYLRVAGTDNVTSYHVYVKPSSWFVLQVMGIIVFFMVLYIFWRNRIELAKTKEELAETTTKYQRVRTDDEESRKLYDRLKTYVEKDKLYLDSNLKMSDLASAMECSTVKMSQLLNMYGQQNYYDFINAYRLEEFKRRLQDSRYDNYTLVALSEMCGFKKSSFFSTFKKMERMTPSEYLKKIGRGKRV